MKGSFKAFETLAEVTKLHSLSQLLRRASPGLLGHPARAQGAQVRGPSTQGPQQARARPHAVPARRPHGLQAPRTGAATHRK